MDNTKKYSTVGQALFFLDLQGYFVKKYKDPSRPKVYDWEVFDINDSAKSLGYYSDAGIIDYANKIDGEIETYSNPNTIVANIEPVKALADGGGVDDDDSFLPMESAGQTSLGSIEPESGSGGQEGQGQQGKPQGEGQGQGKPSEQPSEGEGQGAGENGEQGEGSGEGEPSEGSGQGDSGEGKPDGQGEGEGEGEEGEQSEGQGDGEGDGEEDIIGKECIIITENGQRKGWIGAIREDLTVGDGEKIYGITFSGGGELTLIRSEFAIIGDTVEYKLMGGEDIGKIKSIDKQEDFARLIITSKKTQVNTDFTVSADDIIRLVQEEGAESGEGQEEDGNDLVGRECVIITNNAFKGTIAKIEEYYEVEKVFKVKIDDGRFFDVDRSEFVVAFDKVEVSTSIMTSQGLYTDIGAIQEIINKQNPKKNKVSIEDVNGNLPVYFATDIVRRVQDEQESESNEEENLIGKECVIINEKEIRKGAVVKLERYDDDIKSYKVTEGGFDFYIKREDFTIVGDTVEYINFGGKDSGKITAINNNDSADKNEVVVWSKHNGAEIIIPAKHILRVIQDESEENKPAKPPLFQSVAFLKKLAGEDYKLFSNNAGAMYWFTPQPSWMFYLLNQVMGKGMVKLDNFLFYFDETADPNQYGVEYKKEIAALQELDKKIFMNLYTNFNMYKKFISNIHGNVEADLTRNKESYKLLDKLNIINGTEMHISTRVNPSKWIGVSIFKMDEKNLFVAVYDELYAMAEGLEDSLVKRTLRFVQILEIWEFVPNDNGIEILLKYIDFKQDETTSAKTPLTFKHFDSTLFFNYLCNFTQNKKSKDIKFEFEAHKEEVAEYINGKFKNLYTHV